MLSVPAMRAYLVQIPGAAQAPIDDAALADVINWVLRQWNNETLPEDFEELTLEEVSAARREILADPLAYRIRHWKAFEP